MATTMLPAGVRGWRRHGGALLLGALLLGGCASAPPPAAPDVPWADALFAPPAEVLEAVDAALEDALSPPGATADGPSDR